MPKQLILEKELLGEEIKNVLFYHNTDRQYFGDLLRHAAWIKALSKRKLRVTVATKKDFLTIFENDPSIQTLLPVDDIQEKDFAKYDLTVIPSSFDPTYYSPQIKRGLYSFNRALQYTQYGFVLQTLPKDDLNYFRLAQPKFGQTYLPDGQYYKMHITAAERENAAKILQKLFGTSRDKVIIVNPTASNTFTRENTIKKEVDNLLEIKDYVRIIKNLIELFPSHRILIAAALKRNDKENFIVVERTRKEFPPARVRSITEITTLEEGVSFRAFASILVSPQVVGMLGNGTGTNTHLAATLGVPSVSIERGADDLMKENWKNRSIFQMGSFRWRNPDVRVGTYVLDYSHKSDEDFADICKSFQAHLEATARNWLSVFKTAHLNDAEKAAYKFCECVENNSIQGMSVALKTLQASFINDKVRGFYLNFKDAIEYLSIVDKRTKNKLKNILSSKKVQNIKKVIISNLFKDSNIYKLCYRLSAFRHVKKMSHGELIFRKIRSGCSLTRNELKLLNFSSEAKLSEWLNRQVGPSIDLAIRQYQRNKKSAIPGAWQQIVYHDEKSEYLLKKIHHNKESIYLTDKWCLEGLLIANARAGGLIPHQSELRKTKQGYYHLAKKVMPFMYKRNPEMVILNEEIFQKRDISQTVFPVGWVDDLLNNFLLLIQQKVYNVDMRLVDTGIDKFGAFYALDSGSFKSLRVKQTTQEPIKDPFHLGVNQFALNRVLLSQFKNGKELVSNYDSKVKESIGLDFSGFSLKWKWGDHAKDSIKPLADKLRAFVQKKRGGHSKPVYPFISPSFESLLFIKLEERL